MTLITSKCDITVSRISILRRFSRIMHSVGFFDVGYVKTFEIEHYDSTGGPIIRKLWRTRDRGGGWADCWVHGVRR